MFSSIMIARALNDDYAILIQIVTLIPLSIDMAIFFPVT